MTRPDFPFVKQYSVSAFLFFLFGSDSFSVGFVQFEITFIRCLNCNYIKIDEKESHSHIQNRFLFLKKKRKNQLWSVNYRLNGMLSSWLSPYIYVCWMCVLVCLLARVHIMENYFTFNINNRPKPKWVYRKIVWRIFCRLLCIVSYLQLGKSVATFQCGCFVSFFFLFSTLLPLLLL